MARTRMTFETADGEPVVLPETGLLLFLDETGDESLPTPTSFFGIGGVAVTTPAYLTSIRDAWLDMKEKTLGARMTEFHATDLTGDQRAEVNTLFRSASLADLARVAVSQTQRTAIPAALMSDAKRRSKGHHNYAAMTIALSKRIEAVSKWLPFDEVILVMEHSKKTGRLAKEFLSLWDLQESDGENTRRIPIHCFFATKTLREPGLDMADYVARAAGVQARTELTAPGTSHGDFDAVFRGCDAKRASMLRINEILLD